MTEREARLLPRLIASLDTLEDAGEIANTVRKIREIVGANAFSQHMRATDHPLPGETMPLSREHTLRLRSMALTLRLFGHDQADIDLAASNVCAWILKRRTATLEDVMLTLLFLWDLHADRQRFAMQATGDVLNTVMEAVRRNTWTGDA